MTAVAREVVLVLGMHRSGTSALAGLLVRVGGTPPASLMPADAGNPLGYWESTALVDLHQRLLEAAGTAWDDWSRVEDRWLDSAPATLLVEEARLLFRSEFGDAALCIIKDPRICRFAGFWKRVLQMEGITPKAVLIVRHPDEVWRSLEARDGFDADHVRLLWLRHQLDAEGDTRELVRTVVDYGALVGDPEGVAAKVVADLGLTIASEQWRAGVREWVQPQFRHHHSESIGVPSTTAPSILDRWAARVYSAFRRVGGAHRGNPHALATLDDVRRDFDRAAAVGTIAVESWHGPIGPYRAALEQLMALRAQRDDLARRLSETQRDATAERASAAERERAVQANASALRDQAAALKASADREHGLLVQVAALEEELRALKTSLSWRATAPVRAVVRPLWERQRRR